MFLLAVAAFRKKLYLVSEREAFLYCCVCVFFDSLGVLLFVCCFVLCCPPSRGYPDRDLVTENSKDIIFRGDLLGRGWQLALR